MTSLLLCSLYALCSSNLTVIIQKYTRPALPIQLINILRPTNARRPGHLVCKRKHERQPTFCRSRTALTVDRNTFAHHINWVERPEQRAGNNVIVRRRRRKRLGNSVDTDGSWTTRVVWEVVTGRKRDAERAAIGSNWASEPDKRLALVSYRRYLLLSALFTLSHTHTSESERRNKRKDIRTPPLKLTSWYRSTDLSVCAVFGYAVLGSFCQSSICVVGVMNEPQTRLSRGFSTGKAEENPVRAEKRRSTVVDSILDAVYEVWILLSSSTDDCKRCQC